MFAEQHGLLQLDRLLRSLVPDGCVALPNLKILRVSIRHSLPQICPGAVGAVHNAASAGASCERPMNLQRREDRERRELSGDEPTAWDGCGRVQKLETCIAWLSVPEEQLPTKVHLAHCPLAYAHGAVAGHGLVQVVLHQIDSLSRTSRARRVQHSTRLLCKRPRSVTGPHCRQGSIAIRCLHRHDGDEWRSSVSVHCCGTWEPTCNRASCDHGHD
mmetsp:Transcript_103184/g.266763  ORF Transcript_103184/g.266763 Transcript_103184/m.266763 type:complete len:216 (+) Transcript_103184:156-803(+)